MNGSEFFMLFIAMLAAMIWIAPIVLIASSDRTNGGEKIAWVLAVVFVSWFAWIFYWLIAPINREKVKPEN